MRLAIFITITFFILVESVAAAATTRSDAAPESPRAAFDSVLTTEFQPRRLRVADDLSLLSTDEERTKSSELTKLASKIKPKGDNAKLAAAIHKMKLQRLASSTKKIKADPHKFATKLTSMEFDNFMRLFNGKLTPTKAMTTGKIKNRQQLDKYKDFLANTVGVRAGA
ncbi:Putative RxLR effector [Phytophthora palmivora]|uniref:RxLR effector n=1 Tax=Phytophthora palmivora TaxID=4796 RepID=A0A2P4XJN7_9STRA|nr:Putative RxLR effector [Phytophthora palmivora]